MIANFLPSNPLKVNPLQRPNPVASRISEPQTQAIAEPIRHVRFPPAWKVSFWEHLSMVGDTEPKTVLLWQA